MDDSGVSYTAVTSSNVAAIGYDPVFGRLWVRFNSGRVWAYEKVPSGEYLDFLQAPSKGKYLFRVIRNFGSDSKYAYREVR